MRTERTVGILAFDDMEVLDFAGPYEVFNVAGELTDARVRVISIGTTPGPVTGRGGFTVLPDVRIEDCAPPDILIVPGGAGTRPLLREPRIIDWVRSASEGAELVVSVCTGALLLAAAGLLDGCPATTHHEAFDELVAVSASTRIVEGVRFVQSSQRVWTSAGVSAGVDLSLHLLGLLHGPDVRDTVAAEMEWRW